MPLGNAKKTKSHRLMQLESRPPVRAIPDSETKQLARLGKETLVYIVFDATEENSIGKGLERSIGGQDPP